MKQKHLHYGIKDNKKFMFVKPFHISWHHLVTWTRLKLIVKVSSWSANFLKLNLAKENTPRDFRFIVLDLFQKIPFWSKQSKTQITETGKTYPGKEKCDPCQIIK